MNNFYADTFAQTADPSKELRANLNICVNGEVLFVFWNHCTKPEPTEPEPTKPEPTEPEPTEPPALENPFVDVKEDAYYFNPVLWAVDNDITNGMDATHFGPTIGCSRAQIVTFLWRYAGEPEPESTNNPFTDVKESAFYYKAVLWAAENGITNGTTATTFSPDDTCIRAQIVTFLWRYAGEPAPASQENDFTDLLAGEYYISAVNWAVEQGITTGTTATTFSPYATCERGQVVTFLHRAKLN